MQMEKEADAKSDLCFSGSSVRPTHRDHLAYSETSRGNCRSLAPSGVLATSTTLGVCAITPELYELEMNEGQTLSIAQSCHHHIKH